MSNAVNRGTIALRAGCPEAAIHSAIMPRAEMPVAPTRPFEKGWDTIQSRMERASSIVSFVPSPRLRPKDAPPPRRSHSSVA